MFATGATTGVLIPAPGTTTKKTLSCAHLLGVTVIMFLAAAAIKAHEGQ